MSTEESVQRFNVGDDPEHPTFAMMHPAEAGHWVYHSDYLAEKEAREAAEQLRDVNARIVKALRAGVKEEIERLRREARLVRVNEDDYEAADELEDRADRLSQLIKEEGSGDA